MKKNLITITRHPSVSCYVEEGRRSGKLREGFVSELLRGGYSARSLGGVGQTSFYLEYYNKPQAERDLWIARLGRLRRFTSSNME